MAQTWRVTRARVLAFRVIDALGSPFKRPFRPKAELDTVESILVVEAWMLGDVVLATAALAALRQIYPLARITFLGKAHAKELLENSGLADEMIVFDLPWTARGATLRPWRHDWRGLGALIREMRHRRFDLTVDARMDLRMNLLTFATGARRRVGLDFGGGSFLLTDAVAASPHTRHRVDDWLALMEPFGASFENRGIVPWLKVSEVERNAAAERLKSMGIHTGDLVLGVHGGASHPRRRWPMESFSRVANAISERHGAKILYFLDPGADESSVPPGSAAVRTSIREMMALLDRCDLVLCNDSGPMHVADALDTPVVAVFLTGNPLWHRPYRAWQKTVGAGTGHDFFVAPTEAEVLAAAEQQLVRLRFG